MTDRLTQEEYDILNAVALKKMADYASLASATGRSDIAVAQVVPALVDGGLAVDLGGSVLPTDAAVPRLTGEAAVRFADLRTDPAAMGAADAFEALNSAFLTAMTSWQLVSLGETTVPNDHSDTEYDGKVIDRMDRLVRRLAKLLEPFVAHDARFSRYSVRFEEALDKVDRQPEFISSPTVDSVHNIWFEFHEDLLRSLGRERLE